MEIVKIKKNGKTKYTIYLDNEKDYILYEDIILEYDLLITKNINEKKLNEILNRNKEVEAYYKALVIILKKLRTSNFINKFLKENGYTEKEIGYAFKRLKKEGYLDDKKYADAYIHDQILFSKYGYIKIFNDLVKSDINEEIVKHYLNLYDENFWLDRARNIINKYQQSNTLGLFAFKKKMQNVLYRLGYQNDIINKAIEEIHILNDNTFYKAGEKIYNSLNKKYEGKELVWKFKQKMYVNGFTSEEAEEYLSYVNKN